MIANYDDLASQRLGERLNRWGSGAPDWETARSCAALVRQFSLRTSEMHKRLGLPLIVATLGGTGTGKSTLINALLGAEVVKGGKQRPTTELPFLVCRPEINPELCGIDTKGMILEKRDLPALDRLILIDCPDPDTTENEELCETNLARLRAVMPLCDVIIVTGTQQKYRSRKVAEELFEAAPGARLIFVQTHADRDSDIREDWAKALESQYETGHIFFIDSSAAISAQNESRPLDPEFADLRRLLTRELNEESAIRIRQANYLDLFEETLERCGEKIESQWPSVRKLQEQLDRERERLGTQLAETMRNELIRDRRFWEMKLVQRVASQWGYSPFSLVLRMYQSLGMIASGALLARVRSLPQLAAWGVFEGVRSFKNWADSKRLKQSPGASLQSFWDDGNLRESALILAGFTQDAGLPGESCVPEHVIEESNTAGEAFVGDVSLELDRICNKLADARINIPTRILYESLFGAMLIFLLSRPAYNFFYESLFVEGAEIWPLSSYLVSLFWLLLWSVVLLGMFIFSLRGGLDRQINETAAKWNKIEAMRFLFGKLDSSIEKVIEFRNEHEAIREQLETVNLVGKKLDKRLGRRK